MKAELSAAAAYLFRSVNGWVRLEITGCSGVRFLNICARRGIRIRHLQRKGDTVFRVEIPAADYRKQGRSILRKAGCRARLLKRRGIGMLLHRYRRRRALFVGIPVCLALLLYFGSVVWQIDITGADSADQAVTRSLLSEKGVLPGCFFAGIDTDRLEESLLSEQEDRLAWVGVERVGTTLRVQLAAGTFYSDIPKIPLETPCHVAAAGDGVISRIVPTAGTPLVKPGDVVERGQILISGTVDLKDDYVSEAPILQVHAAGRVTAVVTYAVTVPVEDTVTRVVQTGREDSACILYFPGFCVKWPFWRTPGFEKASVIVTDSFGKVPFGIRRICYQETREESRKLEREEAVAAAKEKASARLNEKIPETSQVLDTSLAVEGGTVRASAVCLEEIGIPVPLQGNS